MREELNRIKIENGCVDCGYNDHSEALEFDHIPGCEKVANISAMLGWGSPQDGLVMQRIRAEIEKCEVVCANCHRIRTANRRSTRD